jgi:hypothetical protein
MDEAAFRIVILVGVALAAVSFIVQAVVMIGIYRLSRAVEQRVQTLTGHIAPAMTKLVPVIEKAGPLLDSSVPAIEKAGRTAEKMGRVAESASALLTSANRIVEDNRPRVSEICGEAVAIADSGRQQVERIGELIYDAGDRARLRLEQIDATVESTVDQVEHAGESLRRAVMRPVREVNGLAAGISAAVSTLVKGPRRPSIDAATQDEEMFI